MCGRPSRPCWASWPPAGAARCGCTASTATCASPATSRPLKTSSYGVASRPGSLAGLYVAISADGLVAGTGLYDPARDQLGRYRAAVLDDASGEALRAAVDAAEAAGLELGAPTLKGTPRGIPRDHPRADLLRFTHLVLFARAPDEALEGRAALDFARTTAADAAPVTDWLDAHVGPSAGG